MPTFAVRLRTVALPSGLTLASEEYGAVDGTPVFFFHGWPSAAVQGALMHDAAEELGIRLIAVSRPGIGRSTPQPGRRLVDWPPVIRQLAVERGFERFRVLGVSGGGPYALACAWALGDLVEAGAVICGVPPLAEIGSARGFNAGYRSMIRVYQRRPWAIRGFFRLMHPLARVSPPGWMLVLMRGVLAGPDKATLKDRTISKICYDGFRGAWGDYRDGVFEDAELYTKPWGFPLEEIRVPVRVWHGTEDRNFSYTLSDYGRRLPRGEVRIVPGEGHYSLPIRHAREILADLVAGSAPAPQSRGGAKNHVSMNHG